jgi:hypothetical protein
MVEFGHIDKESLGDKATIDEKGLPNYGYYFRLLGLEDEKSFFCPPIPSNECT